MFKEKSCLVCGEVFHPTGGCCKVCPACRHEYKKQKQSEYHQARYKQKGSYKWEMPKGEASPSFKTGIGIFVRLAFDNYPHECSVCGSTDNLCVHHKDRNRKNNVLDNLTIVCKACHQEIHTVRDAKGRYKSSRHSPTLPETGDNN